MNELFNEHISYLTQISYEVKIYSNYIKRYVNQKEKIKNCHLNDNTLDDLSWTSLNSDKAVLERIMRPWGLTSRCYLPRNLQKGHPVCCGLSQPVWPPSSFWENFFPSVPGKWINNGSGERHTSPSSWITEALWNINVSRFGNVLRIILWNSTPAKRLVLQRKAAINKAAASVLCLQFPKAQDKGLLAKPAAGEMRWGKAPHSKAPESSRERESRASGAVLRPTNLGTRPLRFLTHWGEGEGEKKRQHLKGKRHIYYLCKQC